MNGAAVIRSVDLAIVGAGPAGCAAAIWAAARGLKVLLVERHQFPRFRPGECIHPGIEPLLRELGVLDEVLARCSVRSPSRTVVIAGKRSVESFGADYSGPWRSFHVSRADLDSILLNRARQLGATIHIHRCRVLPTVNVSNVEGIEVDGQLIRSAFVVDASGQCAWLTRSMGMKRVRASPSLTAFYGYCHGLLREEQFFQANADGWQWIAQVSTAVVNWTSLYFGGHRRPGPPARISLLRSCGHSGGADVTWRIAPSVAGNSYFVVGDAAFVTDPASGNGVLRAIMSGMKAAHSARAVLTGDASPAMAAQGYRAWIRRWFEADVERLSGLYGSLRYDWRDAPHPTDQPT